MNYDFIGDIHGHRRELEHLFERLGYRKEGSDWLPQPDVMPVFLGDFIDRGPDSRGVVDIVRNMVDSKRALAVMGNHEFNAIGYWTPNQRGGHLRPHSKKNEGQHRAFLDQFEEDPEAWREAIEWFMTLPLFLELEEGLRVIHACWDASVIDDARSHESIDQDLMTPEFLLPAFKRGQPEHAIIETLLKGPERERANGGRCDNDGVYRIEERIPWWLDYSDNGFPVVFGHYWWNEIGGRNFDRKWMCVDLGVARNGQLACYRWRSDEWDGDILEPELEFVEAEK